MTTRRVLLVDDEVAILLTLKAVLEINGFTVDTATSAREAEHKLRNADYHMVITDMRMESDAAGIDVVKAAKSAACNPAVAVLTAFPEEGDYANDGADELLVKPMNVQQLVVQMEALLVSHEDKKQKALALAASAAKKRPAKKAAKKAAKPAAKKSAKPAAKKLAKNAPKKRAAKSLPRSKAAKKVVKKPLKKTANKSKKKTSRR